MVDGGLISLVMSNGTVTEHAASTIVTWPSFPRGDARKGAPTRLGDIERTSNTTDELVGLPDGRLAQIEGTFDELARLRKMLAKLTSAAVIWRAQPAAKAGFQLRCDAMMTWLALAGDVALACGTPLAADRLP